MTTEEQIAELKILLDEARYELWAVYEKPVLEQRLIVCELCGHRLRMEPHAPDCLFSRIDRVLLREKKEDE